MGKIDIEKLQELDSSTSVFLKQFDCGVDFVNRTVFITGEIKKSTVQYVYERLNAVVGATGDASTPITLEIVSLGGEDVSMYGVVDTIRTFPTKINTVGRGAVASAAVWILAAGTGERQLTVNTDVMLHQLQHYSQEGMDTIEFQKWSEHATRTQMKAYRLLGSFCKRPSLFWENMCKNTTYLTPEQCLEYGIIDSIIG